MKKQLLWISGISLVSVFSYSQTSVTQPNGVIVHQAQGVEAPLKSDPSQPIVKTINEWSLAECLDAEPYFYNKLQNAATEEEKNYYSDQVAILQKRKAELTKTTK
jgi:hypothetical protein